MSELTIEDWAARILANEPIERVTGRMAFAVCDMRIEDARGDPVNAVR